METDFRVKKVADAIRAARENLDLTQEDFARESDLARSYYGRLERGEQNISLTRLFHLAASLNVRPAELLKDVTLDDCLALTRPSKRRRRPKA